MSYVGFVRLMQDPYHVMRTITKARRELFDKKNRNEDEDESSDEEEDIDSDESGDDVGDGGSEIGDVTSSMDEGGSALDPGVSTMSSKSKKSGSLSAGPSKVSTVGDPTGSQTIKDVEGNVEDEEEEEQDWELLMPIDKYGRMAILLLEECRHNFLKAAKDNDDLEESFQRSGSILQI